jgi:ABC-2 type transport system permease protein
MFRHIVAFEWRYQLKSPVFWVGCFIFFLMAFGATASDNVQIGSLGNVHKNAPFAIVQALSQLGVFSIFVTIAMVAGVVVRDDETNFASIIRTTSVNKASYLGGRFLGACAAALVVLAMIPLGVLVGSLMPWQDFEKIGPFMPGDYLYALLLVQLPTLLITSAVFFALATATRSMAWTYLSAVGLLVLFKVMRSVAGNDPALEHVAALFDPFGISALDYVTKYWTASDRNTTLPSITGVLLANRLLWIAVAAAVFGLAYRSFRFEIRFEKPAGAADDVGKPARIGRLSRAQKAARVHQAELETLGQANPAGVREVLAADARRSAVALPAIPPASRASVRAQLRELTLTDMAFVFRSPAYPVLLAISLLLAVGTVLYAGDILGSPSYPVTRLMVSAMSGAFLFMSAIIAIYYSGELVWRDRDRRMHEIIDSTAAPDWTHLIPKTIAISLVLLSTVLVAVVAAIGFQASKGYFRFEIGGYLAWFVWPLAVLAIQMAVLSTFVQVLVPQKFIGWAVMLVWFVSTIVLNNLGFEHNLYNYASVSEVPLSDMNGVGRFWIGQLWFQVYWSAFAMMLLVATHALWRRGATVELRPRLRQMGRRLRGRPAKVLAVSAAVWVASGGWIFYNTNVLNPYTTGPERERRAADFEKTLLPFEKVLQPKVADVSLDVELFPRAARAVTHGRYTLVNRGTQPIGELHLQWAQNLALDSIALPGATVKIDYPRFHYRIYALASPIQPGEQRTLGFTTTLEQRGFVNGRPLTSVVPNGSFVNNFEIAPSVGFMREGLLEERAKRRKYGLPAELRPPKLEDDSARQFNTFLHDSDWVTADITVTTDGDQTPIAPGQTISDTGPSTDRNARRTVHFRSDAPMNQFFSIQSGRYDVRHAVWHAPAAGDQAARDVDLAVYYAPGHEFNVKRMLDAMQESLALYSKDFTPYQFKQARIVEFPAYAAFAQSFANTIPFSEAIGFVQHFDEAKHSKIDVATYVTAHEIGHQWWGHQLVPSDQQGASMLVESFAQYSALLVMEQHYGKEQVRRFLKYELDRYLSSRGGAVLEELPLDRVEDQQYIYYRKGSVAMYWAKEALGEDVVDRAMRRLLAEHAFKGAPYPNTTDFLKILRAEAGPANDQVITDLFDKITLLDLKATNASARKLPDGKYEVKFDVTARKFYADGAGKETEVPMDEQVDVGVFSAQPGDKDFDASRVLLLHKVPIHGPTVPVSVVVDSRPTWVGIDPYNKRIDRNTDDNLTKVDAAP